VIPHAEFVLTDVADGAYKTKVFDSGDSTSLENEINRWLEECQRGGRRITVLTFFPVSVAMGTALPSEFKIGTGSGGTSQYPQMTLAVGVLYLDEPKPVPAVPPA